MSAGCGKKGPPLAPLHLVPEPAGNVTARRLGDTIYLQMTAPRRNANGPGPVSLDRLEIYAVTAAPAATPPNRELFTNARIVAKIPVKPPPTEDEAAPSEDAPQDTRPAPGDVVTFAEQLTEAQLKPQYVAPATPASTTVAAPPSAPEPAPASATAAPPPALAGPPDIVVPAAGGSSIGGVPGVAPIPPPSAAGAALPATPTAAPTGAQTSPAQPAAPSGAGQQPPGTTAAAAATAAARAPSVPTRIYVVRGIARGGRAGTPSSRVAVPLVEPPPIPPALSTSFTEAAVTISWLPPVADRTSVLPMKFNVYSAPAAQARAQPASDTPLSAAPAPLNAAPLEAPSFEHAGAEPGVERCFIVRTVETIGGATIESDPSARVCVTPRDIFPPAAPKNLSAVAGPGAINLIWDANTEGDLAGYVILRGEAPGDTLQPVNAEPSRETRYRDTTTAPGVRYVYAIVAIDRAGNRSPASVRVEETAR